MQTHLKQQPQQAKEKQQRQQAAAAYLIADSIHSLSPGKLTA